MDTELLKAWAAQWACLLYAVRGGCPGFIQYTPRLEPTPPIASSDTKKDGHNSREPIPLTARVIRVTGKLEPVVYQSEKREKFRSDLQVIKQLAGVLVYVEPVPRAGEIWERLKSVKRPHAMSETLKTLREWALSIRGPSVHLPGSHAHPVFSANARSEDWTRAAVGGAVARGEIPSWPLLPFAISEDWAGEIVKAKNLWTYPKSDRPKSDDKRIEFFAKCFAALKLGKSPATATARWLAGWHWPKDWLTRETPYAG